GHRPERHRARVAVPGEPGLQQGRLDPLRVEPDLVPALCGRRPGDRLGLDIAGQGLHRLAASGHYPAVSRPRLASAITPTDGNDWGRFPAALRHSLYALMPGLCVRRSRTT